MLPAHDTVAAGPAGHGGVGDEELLQAASADGRALVTNNARHFAPIARRYAAEGRTHHGVLLTSDVSLPRGSATIGLFVEVLASLCHPNPGDAALRDQVRWLVPPHGGAG